MSDALQVRIEGDSSSVVEATDVATGALERIPLAIHGIPASAAAATSSLTDLSDAAASVGTVNVALPASLERIAPAANEAAAALSGISAAAASEDEVAALARAMAAAFDGVPPSILAVNEGLREMGAMGSLIADVNQTVSLGVAPLSAEEAAISANVGAMQHLDAMAKELAATLAKADNAELAVADGAGVATAALNDEATAARAAGGAVGGKGGSSKKASTDSKELSSALKETSHSAKEGAKAVGALGFAFGGAAGASSQLLRGAEDLMGAFLAGGPLAAGMAGVGIVLATVTHEMEKQEAQVKRLDDEWQNGISTFIAARNAQSDLVDALNHQMAVQTAQVGGLSSTEAEAEVNLQKTLSDLESKRLGIEAERATKVKEADAFRRSELAKVPLELRSAETIARIQDSVNLKLAQANAFEDVKINLLGQTAGKAEENRLKAHDETVEAERLARIESLRQQALANIYAALDDQVGRYERMVELEGKLGAGGIASAIVGGGIGDAAGLVNMAKQQNVATGPDFTAVAPALRGVARELLGVTRAADGLGDSLAPLHKIAEDSANKTEAFGQQLQALVDNFDMTQGAADAMLQSYEAATSATDAVSAAQEIATRMSDGRIRSLQEETAAAAAAGVTLDEVDAALAKIAREKPPSPPSMSIVFDEMQGEIDKLMAPSTIGAVDESKQPRTSALERKRLQDVADAQVARSAADVARHLEDVANVAGDSETAFKAHREAMDLDGVAVQKMNDAFDTLTQEAEQTGQALASVAVAVINGHGFEAAGGAVGGFAGNAAGTAIGGAVDVASGGATGGMGTIVGGVVGGAVGGAGGSGFGKLIDQLKPLQDAGALVEASFVRVAHAVEPVMVPILKVANAFGDVINTAVMPAIMDLIPAAVPLAEILADVVVAFEPFITAMIDLNVPLMLLRASAQGLSGVLKAVAEFGDYLISNEIDLANAITNWVNETFHQHIATLDPTFSQDSKDANCFTLGSPITTPRGPRPLRDIVAGDVVTSWDAETGEFIPQRVGKVLRSWVFELIVIEVGGCHIETTDYHRFLVLNRGIPHRWLMAGDLIVGDMLLGADGARMSITDVTRRAGHVEVGNLEIDGVHSFCVGERAVVVHNGDKKKEALAAAKANAAALKANTAALQARQDNLPAGAKVAYQAFRAAPVTMTININATGNKDSITDALRRLQNQARDGTLVESMSRRGIGDEHG